MNPYAQAARARKVAAIVALVPPGKSLVANLCAAGCMTLWTQEDRNRFAAAANQRHPSPETWQEVCRAVMDRPIP